MNASLINQKMTDLLFKSDLGNESKTIQVGIKYDLEVLNSEINTNSRARIRYYIENVEDSSAFQLTIGLEGIIEHDAILSPDDKKELHLKAYDMLFPYVQFMISQIAGFAGLSPLMIPKDKLIMEHILIKEDNHS